MLFPAGKTCKKCGREIDKLRLGVGFQVEPFNLNEETKKYEERYWFICEECLCKKIFGGF